ncbi:universal stress protein UspA-like protein [Halovivax ruber XH-70]|uniref:Universal stress protein UspA-like protein n=1 Tax=Halovivax ruber (strain DSM 18193 / JCM 13892 / XH-70) TaxID=797302 RepID=L0IAM8_HALRX|nr:universal stress protein [Halovivax ruber]AGB15281.1 universal stress protein UspA-like protein [Halovivax ruber XH-70]
MTADRLLVPVANPETADRLLETAVDVAQDRGLELLVVHVIDVPSQTSLEQARASMDREPGESVVSQTVERARAAGVEATGLVRYGHDVAGSLVDLASGADVEAMLLGWHGRPRRRDIVLGSYIDTVLREAACDVLVERVDRDRGPIESVFVPVAGGPHTEYAAEIAGSIARERDASVELATVVAVGADEETVEEAQALLAQTSPALGAVDSVATTVLRSNEVSVGIVDHTAEHGLTILGAGGSGLLHRIVADDVAESVARQADSDVLLCRQRDRPAKTLLYRLQDGLRGIGR